MKYIQQHFSINFVPHSLRIQYRPSEDTMMIDISAIQSLEIMQNLRNPKSKDSLFGLMNHTTTPMGARMLRSSILQPPTRADLYITPRYEALDELTTNEEMFREIRKGDSARLIVVPKNMPIQKVEEQINQVLMVKSFLEAVSELYIALEPATSDLLVKVRDLCHPELINRGLDKIRHTIEADVTYMKSALDLWNQRTFAVKGGINGMLDVARQTYKEQTEEVHKYLDRLNETHGFSASLKYDNGRKYWFRLRAADFEGRPLPDEFINVVRKKDKIECQTLALIKLNTMDGGFVPNDYFASESFAFHIVTGCNMSGKSTYIRAAALLQIMAQIGSFVPAKYAAFSIVHSIFARVSLDDNIESNLSTFSVEMREMAFILRNIDDKSLAVIDELGRATSNRDGLAIAIAMSEALIQSKASVWFATHFADLTRAFAQRPGVLNLHLAATTSTTADGLPHIKMLYKATTGTVGDEHYGINLARAIGLPRGFIDKAEEVAKDIRRKREASKCSSESSRLLARRNMILNLWAALKQARDSGTEEGLLGYLKQLQAEFVIRMEELDGQ
ncbi:MutS protein msh4 [Fusarium falciforme]|nr:MutS protein msh4 [Fusarium falciforme]